MSQFNHRTIPFLPGVSPLEFGEAIAYWTGLTLHATAGSRSVVNADIKVGHVVQLEAEQHERQSLGSQYAKSGDVLIVGQPTTTDLLSGRFIVTGIISEDINTSPDPIGASTKRKGGWIKVRTAPGEVLAFVPGSTSAKVALAVGNASLNLIATPGIASITAIRQHCATTLEANAGGDVALRRVWFWGS